MICYESRQLVYSKCIFEKKIQMSTNFISNSLFHKMYDSNVKAPIKQTTVNVIRLQ